jgi:hypothetical protein
MQSVQVGDWLIKASSLDDQILITGYKKDSIDSFVELFYDEETAYSFMEKIYDKNSQNYLG